MREIDKTFLMEIAEEYGTPVYVISKRAIVESYNEFVTIAGKYFRNFLVAYSYKANRNPFVCSVFKDLGALADVVSGIELNVAKKVGLPGERIIFNSPYKTGEEIKESMELGIMSLNIDSLEELERVKRISHNIRGSLNVGVRIRPEIRAPIPPQFGLDLESAKKAVRKIKEYGFNFSQIHAHIGTQITDLVLWNKFSEFMRKAADDIEREIEVPAINMGGGYPLKRTPKLFDEETPSLENIMRSIREGLDDYNKTLIFEPGRILVGPSAILLTRVVSKKISRDGKPILIVDSSVYSVNTAFYLKHEVISVDREGRLVETDIYGCSCSATDALRIGCMLPPVREGDLLAIMDCGAYSFYLDPEFHRKRPKVLFVDEKGLREVRE
ncbi:diaminopimelate decarboxylase family protein [Candidatus Methanodesulfokora washburnensis]|jgi:diaminopimelate decarboxylase|nr:hypothetical protein [Candidatus Methanodesulfokores washburnensis]